jgi:YtkA-like
MKAVLMLVMLLLVSLVMVACGEQSAAPPASLDINMVARVEPEPPAVGESTLIVTLKDASSAPIDGAMLRVQGNMEHAGMAAVNREINQSSNGEYRIPFEWSMGGGWVVEVTAQLPNNGGETSKTFEFFVEAVSSESIINRPGTQDQTPESQTNTATEAGHSSGE